MHEDPRLAWVFVHYVRQAKMTLTCFHAVGYGISQSIGPTGDGLVQVAIPHG